MQLTNLFVPRDEPCGLESGSLYRKPKKRTRVLLAISFALLLLAMLSTSLSAQTDVRSGSTRQKKVWPSDYGRLPISFEANAGQAEKQIKFLSRGQGFSLFLTGKEAVIALKKAQPKAEGLPARDFEEIKKVAAAEGMVLRMQLAHANETPRVVGLEELPGKANYFIGNDPSKWRTNVPTYAKVKYEGVYPGVDLVYYGSRGQLEYDFVVAPSADPNRIQLKFRDVGQLRIDEKGDLLLGATGGEVRFQKPLVYQEIGGEKKSIQGSYVMVAANRISFRVPDYDHSKPLVIDPVFSYSTYLGGGGTIFETGTGIAVDASGNAYITGSADSVDFPTANPLQWAYGGGSSDAFVTKINATGSALLYSTYLGGTGDDVAFGISVDGAGNAYVTGTTGSADFPTANALQWAYGGGSYDAFVTKINSTGSALVYSTYLGGENNDLAHGIATDTSGNAYVTGSTSSTYFPTANALQGTLLGYSDAFVTKINATGSALVYSTYLGGDNDDAAAGIATDASGNAYVTGGTSSTNFPTVNALQATLKGSQDAFVTKLNASGSGPVYSTYLGGSNQTSGISITVDVSGSAYVAGHTSSADFPTVNAFQATLGGITDAFVTKLNANGSALVYSTYLGGSNPEDLGSIAVNGSGEAYLTGVTNSVDFPTFDAFQPTLKGSYDAFVTKLNASGSALVYSTYLGGSGRETGYAIAVDAAGNAYATGSTESADFPTENAFQAKLRGTWDAFVTKIAEADTTPPVVTLFTSPIMLWPPHRRMLPVTISGTIEDDGSGVNVNTAAYAVIDEYGQVQPSGLITLGADGSYSFTILLEAARAGADKNGRQYTITVSAEDNATNLGFVSTVVTVPHDQGH